MPATDFSLMTRPGFAVIYRWRLRPGHEPSFVDAWSRTTLLLREQRGALGSRLHRGALGSRLHRGADGLWYAYAQWPSAATREASRAQGPVDAECARIMSEAIAEALPEIVLEPVADLLQSPPG